MDAFHLSQESSRMLLFRYFQQTMNQSADQVNDDGFSGGFGSSRTKEDRASSISAKAVKVSGGGVTHGRFCIKISFR